ncbi:abortive phage infection protein [Streptomyces sp. DSM 44917]|uniref:Abortive phage infection protein n=1 Tax=Streptomyces boetiae TaxID=3075541 RepID=A0ABU2L2X8_9ACTN|nr:abortive phage infection protein [Streptomyces sp. DSM 44917]MDT0305920.1 abortive phage infection protein [Streptomyces sp. DSM 44917]
MAGGGERKGIGRSRFVGGAAAGTLGALAGLGAFGTARAGAAGGDRRGGLTLRGVNYEVTDGESPATGWNARRMRADLRAIRDALHAGSVMVFGDGVERLAATAEEAAGLGLHVWLQPRLGDVPEADILEHLAETGRRAEHMRRQGARVHLHVGCEFVLFVPGIVPGADAVERVRNLLDGTYDPVHMARELRRFTGLAARTGRSVFRGALTYGAAHGEEVDWDLFDIVSVNYYEYHRDRAAYARELSAYRRWGRPVAISECGTCTFEGAPEAGGMGWDVVDYGPYPPEIRGGLVRSERAQAAYLAEVMDVFESLSLYSATVYSFVTPDAPHWPGDPLHDLDIASYSLVRTIRGGDPSAPGPDWHWEPKESFRTLARLFARARRS